MPLSNDGPQGRRLTGQSRLRMQRGIRDEMRRWLSDKLSLFKRWVLSSFSDCGTAFSVIQQRTMAVARAWIIVAAAMLLVAVYADVKVLNSTALDARLPTTSVGHLDPSKYALPLPSNATSASAKGDALR